jgi:hypothetical protein
MNFNNLKLQTVVYNAIYVVIGVLVLLKGPIYYPDSYTFLRMGFNRSPVYSSFLKVFTSVFGDNFELPVILVQYVFIALAIHFFVKVFKETFKVTYLSTIILQLLLLAPCIHWHFVANKLLSESLSYPLFLVIFTLTFKTVVTKNIKYIFLALVPLYVLLFTRSQFIALLPVIIITIVYINYKKKNIKKSLTLLAVIVLLPFIVSLSQRIYNKIVHDQYVNYAMTYVHFIASPFYIASADDVTIFKNEEQKKLFKRTYSSLLESRLTRNQVIELEQDDYEFFQKNFTKICNANVHQLNLDYYKTQGLDFYQQQLKVDKLSKQMLVPLIKQNFKNWIKLFLKNLKNSFGFSKYLLLFLVILLYSLLMLKRRDNNMFLFFALSILFMFANNILIAMVVHSINRYTFYFDWVLFAIIILLLDSLYKKHLNAN